MEVNAFFALLITIIIGTSSTLKEEIEVTKGAGYNY